MTDTTTDPLARSTAPAPTVPSIPGFDAVDVPVADGVTLHAAVGGSGRPVVLLHGFPQTHLMWRHVAARLAADHTVVCPDLRGYGASSKPAATSPDTYSKRTMAADVVALARALGHERFALVGHDRGLLVALRAGLDHPDAVTHLGLLDAVPTLDTWAVLQGRSAAAAFHLYLMAQPPGLPEALIGASPDVFFGHFLDAWTTDPGAMPDDVRAAYLRASAAAVPSIVADFRATAGVDVEHEQADRDAGRRLAMPVSVVQQDWGAALGYDAAAVWRPWADDLELRLTGAGHFLAETAPDEVVADVRALLER
ncbi:alpha/beta hydrolase [uncultured Pseudokineococcus sp.]|uniref:alpha/beta fold hydrolase n=1 Tax=uncultured Pseudokineococcus sp. TaxID=1642928 RepID=UPI00260A7225|nr:alpha/beta hydrolase [uncultured Pseudokineococcus sp.]